jgi:thymidylate kinase
LRRILVISGLDGSGKSAHAFKLFNELNSIDIPADYLWMRGIGRIFLSLPLLALSKAIGITKVHVLKNKLKVSEYNFHLFKPIRYIWPLVQFLDSIFFTLLLIQNPLKNWNKILIIDRSVIDTYVDASVDTKNEKINSLFEKCMISMLPKTSCVIVLDVKEEIAMKRKNDVISIEYLIKRRRLYRRLALTYGYPLISTELPFDFVHDKISKKIKMMCELN